jgi:hypothetical protein
MTTKLATPAPMTSPEVLGGALDDGPEQKAQAGDRQHDADGVGSLDSRVLGVGHQD